MTQRSRFTLYTRYADERHTTARRQKKTAKQLRTMH